MVDNIAEDNLAIKDQYEYYKDSLVCDSSLTYNIHHRGMLVDLYRRESHVHSILDSVA